MYPGRWGPLLADRPALVMHATGETLTHGQLDARSTQLAHLLREMGLQRGDTVALLMQNHIEYLVAFWATRRCGLYVTPINWHLSVPEADYIVGDSEAKALIATEQLLEAAQQVEAPGLQHRLLITTADRTPPPGWVDYRVAVERQSTSPLPDESGGASLLYSSGTTGRPKGILVPLPDTPPWELDDEAAAAAHPNLWGFDTETVYLSPAPLYHAAPLHTCRRVHEHGGCVVIMDRFDPTESLVAIERHRITHSQWVPTMFVRMLKLPEATRTGFDLSSHQMAIHAAAPCPKEVKHQMMDWWGPILHEYYAGSESIGVTIIGPQEWLEHPGSVGKADPERVFVLDEHGVELPPGDSGLIHFNPTREFTYKGDPAKTADATSPQGYITYGDVGYVSADGYLYLTDRQSFMIISGGVNIYPREAEDVLIGHPAVADVGVFGVPNDDLGEEAKAAVQLQVGYAPTAELADELLAYCRQRLSTYKCPRSIDFEDELPRLPTGKLRKADLRHRYRPEAE